MRISSIGLGCLLSVAAVGCVGGGGNSSDSPAAQAGMRKAFMVVLENTGASSALAQPFLKQLASQGAYLNNFSAITHPSQPNYVAMVSGGTQGVADDNDHDLSGMSVADLIEARGKTWKAYNESYPGNCFTGTTSGTYARKHNPFISFNSIHNSASRCANIVPATQLDTDIANGTLPDFSFYAPDLSDDGHDTGVAYADSWLQGKFGPLLSDRRFMDGMLFIVTFDENDGSSPNLVYTTLYGDGVSPGKVSNNAYDFYSLLRTVEDMLGVGNLGAGDATATPIGDVWKSNS